MPTSHNKFDDRVLNPVSYGSEADLLMNLHKPEARVLEMHGKLVKRKVPTPHRRA